MNSSMMKTTCRVLVASLLALSFTTARAGLVSADQAAAGQVPTERALVLGTLDRADVASRLLQAGVDPQDARARVAAMSDQEVHSLAQDIQALPAGAMGSAGWLAVILVGVLVWYFAFRK